MKTLCRIKIAFCFSVFSSLVHSQNLQIPDAQAYSSNQFGELTAQIGVRAGGDALQQPYIRLTLPKFKDRLALFVDGSNPEFEADGIAFNRDVEFQGNAYSYGAFLTGFDPVGKWSVTLRFSLTDYEGSVRESLAVAAQQLTVDREATRTSIAAIFSPIEPLLQNGSRLFFSLGATLEQVEQKALLETDDYQALSYSETNVLPYLAAGWILPRKRLEWFAAVDVEESVALSVGLRLPLTRSAE